MRDRKRRRQAQGIQVVNEADESATGPVHFIFVDPAEFYLQRIVEGGERWWVSMGGR